jgi:hypothetical protein
MKPFLIVKSLFVLSAGAAEACSPLPPPLVRFETNSAAVPADRLEVLRSLAGPAKANNPKCLAFDFSVFVDPTEKGEVAAARVEAVKAVLQGEGVAGSQIMSKVEAPAATASPMTRSVVVNRNWTAGQWRCDPASHNPNAIAAACQKTYSRCYLQLADGTVCNPDNVPNPNPATYSVVN